MDQYVVQVFEQLYVIFQYHSHLLLYHLFYHLHLFFLIYQVEYHLIYHHFYHHLVLVVVVVFVFVYFYPLMQQQLLVQLVDLKYLVLIYFDLDYDRNHHSFHQLIFHLQQFQYHPKIFTIINKNNRIK